MRTVKEQNKIDAVADREDKVQIETQTQHGKIMLYVHVNGETVLRIGQIRGPRHVEYKHDGEWFAPGDRARGEQDGISRTNSRPGDGDMGG